MPSIAVDIPIKKVAEIISNMSPSELETLLIELDPEQSQELKSRLHGLRGEIKEGKVLTIDQVFDDV